MLNGNPEEVEVAHLFAQKFLVDAERRLNAREGLRAIDGIPVRERIDGIPLTEPEEGIPLTEVEDTAETPATEVEAVEESRGTEVGVEDTDAEVL